MPLMAARRGCWSGPRHEETSSGRDTHSRSTFRSGSNLGSLLGCRDASACCCCETARLHRCRLRWARSSTPRAPRSRDIPWPTLSFSDVCRFLSGRPVQSEGARESSRLAGATLLVPQGGARDVGRRLHVRRCAASAARVSRCLRADERVLLRASQDRSHLYLQPWSRSRRLIISRARTAHGYVRLVAKERRREGRGLVVRAICTSAV